jgi:hypothetical protein
MAQVTLGYSEEYLYPYPQIPVPSYPRVFMQGVPGVKEGRDFARVVMKKGHIDMI